MSLTISVTSGEEAAMGFVILFEAIDFVSDCIVVMVGELDVVAGLTVVGFYITLIIGSKSINPA